MSDSNEPEFQISYDERISRDDSLLAAVQAATNYFIEQYEPRGEDRAPASPAISWWIQPGSPTPVRVKVEEHSPFDGQEVFQSLSLEDVRGERERNVSMLRLWRKLLELRSEKRIPIMERLLREIEEQEGGRGVSN